MQAQFIGSSHSNFFLRIKFSKSIILTDKSSDAVIKNDLQNDGFIFTFLIDEFSY